MKDQRFQENLTSRDMANLWDMLDALDSLQFNEASTYAEDLPTAYDVCAARRRDVAVRIANWHEGVPVEEYSSDGYFRPLLDALMGDNPHRWAQEFAYFWEPIFEDPRKIWKVESSKFGSSFIFLLPDQKGWEWDGEVRFSISGVYGLFTLSDRMGEQNNDSASIEPRKITEEELDLLQFGIQVDGKRWNSRLLRSLARKGFVRQEYMGNFRFETDEFLMVIKPVLSHHDKDGKKVWKAKMSAFRGWMGKTPWVDIHWKR